MATIHYFYNDPFETFFNSHIKRTLNRFDRKISRLMSRLPLYALIGYALICSMFLILFFLASNRVDSRICSNASKPLEIHCPTK
jgi:hypothetical protein